MIVKSAIAGTVLSLMAGGVVYFGTDVETENVAESSAVETLETSETKLAGETHPHTEKTSADKKIKAKKVVVKKAKLKPVKKVEAEPEPEKKWLEQYLKTEKPKATSEGHETGNGAQAKDTGKFVVKKKTVKKDKSVGMKSLPKEEMEKATKDRFEKRLAEVENVWVEKADKKIRKTERRVLKDILKDKSAVFIGEGEGERHVDVKVMKDEDGETRIETETIDMGDRKIMKIVKKTVTSGGYGTDGQHKMRVKVLADEDFDGGMDVETLKMGDGKTIKIIKKNAMGDLMVDGHDKIFISKEESRDISSVVETVMEQAEKIRMPELRDRAYLDLVSYALKHKDYKVADKALTKIEQVELRDTARNRIAVAYAKAGHSNEAFAILEDIEVEALRDVMRLQVIEAMIAPKELPKDMQ